MFPWCKEVHFDFFAVSVSKASFSVLSDLRRRNFSTSCLLVNSSLFLDMGTKLRPLLRTDFSAFERGRFSESGRFSSPRSAQSIFP